MNWVKRNPTQAAGIFMVLVGWLALLHVPAAIITGLGTIVGILTSSVVHNAVTPVATAEAKIADAATQAATQVAENLNSTSAGKLGEVTEAAQTTVQTAVGDAVHAVLGK